MHREVLPILLAREIVKAVEREPAFDVTEAVLCVTPVVREREVGRGGGVADLAEARIPLRVQNVERRVRRAVGGDIGWGAIWNRMPGYYPGTCKMRDMSERLPSAFLAAALLALLPCAVPAAAGCRAAQPGAAADRGGETPCEDLHEHAATARHPFDDIDKWVRIFDDPARDEWQKPEQVVKALGLGEGQRVADIGAGTGYFSRHLAEAVGESGRVYAIDTEREMVEHMARRAEKERTPQVQAILAAPDDPKIPEGGADLVLMVDTYHHIDDRVRYLRRLARSLRPGGRLAIIDFEKRPLPVGPPLDHKLARETVLEELEEAGYRLVEEPGILPHQYFLIFAPPGS